jgi:hypothetical protein
MTKTIGLIHARTQGGEGLQMDSATQKKPYKVLSEMRTKRFLEFVIVLNN